MSKSTKTTRSAKASKNSRMQKGSGIYACSACGKKTRATGRGDNENVGLCATCYDRAGDENAVADGKMTKAEFEAAWGKGAKKAEPKVHQGKHPAIENGGTTICNEQVGIHFRIKQGLEAPSAGDLVMVKVGREQVVLVVRHTQECVNGETLVQAFTGLRQSDGETPAYKILASAKGESVQVFWHL